MCSEATYSNVAALPHTLFLPKCLKKDLTHFIFEYFRNRAHKICDIARKYEILQEKLRLQKVLSKKNLKIPHSCV
jgi:hypothetical protein